MPAAELQQLFSWGAHLRALLLALHWRIAASFLSFSEEYRWHTMSKRPVAGCWGAEYTFDMCCHTYNDMARLTDNYTANVKQVFMKRIWAILNARQALAGYKACFLKGSLLTYENCCSLNADHGMRIAWNQVFRMLATPWANIVLVQGATLDNYMDPSGKGSLPFGGAIAYQGVQSGDGEGIIWPTGARAALVLAQLNFTRLFNASGGRARRGRRRFLELSSGTGAPSLVALARGFAVWSTDVSLESAWQRRASVRATFGEAASSELGARFFTPKLNLLDEFTWPAPRPQGGAFDVILMSGAFPVRGQEATRMRMCLGFRKILRRLLLPGGVGLFVLHEEAAERHNASGHLKACLAPDAAFDVVVHRQDLSGLWHSRCLRTWPLAVTGLDLLCQERCLSIISFHRRVGRRCSWPAQREEQV